MGGKEQQQLVVVESDVAVTTMQESTTAATVAPAPAGIVAESNEVTVKELACRMAAFAAAREWDQFHSPRNLLLALVGGSGRAVGDLPVERRGTARALRLERRGEGALGRGALGRAPLPGSLSRRVQRQPRGLRPAKAPEERHQVPRGALQGQQQEVQRAREEHHQQHQHHGDGSTLVNNFICHLTFPPFPPFPHSLLFHIPSLDLPGAQPALFKTNSCRFTRLESSGVVTRSHLLHCILNLQRIGMWHSLLNL